MLAADPEPSQSNLPRHPARSRTRLWYNPAGYELQDYRADQVQCVLWRAADLIRKRDPRRGRHLAVLGTWARSSR